VKIGLHGIRPVGNCLTECRQRVLRVGSHRPAVGDDQRPGCSSDDLRNTISRAYRSHAGPSIAPPRTVSAGRKDRSAAGREAASARRAARVITVSAPPDRARTP
jgi:hypothetical protein